MLYLYYPPHHMEVCLHLLQPLPKYCSDINSYGNIPNINQENSELYITCLVRAGSRHFVEIFSGGGEEEGTGVGTMHYFGVIYPKC